jgi:hypothetical protein
MTATRVAVAACALAVVAALAGCTSTTDGQGSDATSSGAVTSSSPDFPSTSATAAAPDPSPTSRTGAPPTNSAGSSAPATPLETVTTQGPTPYTVQVWARRTDPTCYDHAYGQPMITFLTRNPCHGMERLLATTTVGGRPVAFSLVQTSFVGTPKNPYGTTEKFRALVERDGTGSIDDLLREGYRLPRGPKHVPSPDAFNCLGQDNGVSVYDVWYLDGPTPENAKPLVRMTEDVFLQL